MKKIHQCFCLIGVFVLSSFIFSATLGFAQEQVEIPSQGNVGFYGTYEKPTNSTEISETIPKGEITKNSENQKMKNKESHVQGLLPHTGEKKARSFYVVGVLIIGLVVLLLILKKRRNEEKK